MSASIVPNTDFTDEFKSIEIVVAVLESLDADQSQRVLNFAQNWQYARDSRESGERIASHNQQHYGSETLEVP